MVLVAMLISCRCSSVSVWKRRMEEPEEKAIQTPLPAFTMCVTLTASSWCASKLCCGTDGGGGVGAGPGLPAQPLRGPSSSGLRLDQSQGCKGASEAQHWGVGTCVTGRGILVCRVCRVPRCKHLNTAHPQRPARHHRTRRRARFARTWLLGVDGTGR